MERVLILVLFLGVSQTLGENNLLSSYSSCQQECSKHDVHVENHTDPFSKNTNFDACMRGCRFYIFSDLLALGRNKLPVGLPEGLTPATYECYQSCTEAYNSTAQASAACNDGCDAQEKVNKQFAEKAEKEEATNQAEDFHLLKPLMQIKEISSKMLGGMMRVVQSSITMFFMREDDKTVVAVRGPTEIRFEMVPPKSGIHPPVSSDLPEVVDPTPESFFENFVGGRYHKSEHLVRNSDSPGVSAVKKHSNLKMSLFISTFFFIFLVIGIFVMALCRMGATKERPKSLANLSPSKMVHVVNVIRTEDLTKLSLMEEDEKFGMKLPESSKI